MLRPRVNIGRKDFQSTFAEFRKNDNLWKGLGGSQVNLGKDVAKGFWCISEY